MTPLLRIGVVLLIGSLSSGCASDDDARPDDRDFPGSDQNQGERPDNLDLIEGIAQYEPEHGWFLVQCADTLSIGPLWPSLEGDDWTFELFDDLLLDALGGDLASAAGVYLKGEGYIDPIEHEPGEFILLEIETMIPVDGPVLSSQGQPCVPLASFQPM